MIYSHLFLTSSYLKNIKRAKNSEGSLGKFGYLFYSYKLKYTNKGGYEVNRAKKSSIPEINELVGFWQSLISL